MTSISPLRNIHSKGLFGNHEDKKEENLVKVSEINNLLIVQIVQFKNSQTKLDQLKIDNLFLENEALKVNSNDNTRVLWIGPNNWLLISTKKDLLKNICEIFKESDFAVTDLSHSKTIIQIEGSNVKEALKKGCPFNFNTLNKNNCVNSTFNGLALTIDMINENPDKVRLYVLRSFGESFYHSITDALLEFGYKCV